MTATPSTRPSHFIHEIIDEDLRTNRNGAGTQVATRFPPEPNGYLHIGHAKSICLNFGTARKYNGRCHLRMDDTNPTKEEQEYIDSIKQDVRWLGFDWGAHEYHASDYFEQLYQWALLFIKAGKAYVCDLTPEEVSKSRGSLTSPGKESPFRGRSVAENLDLFERMHKGEFPDGSHTLRAKIDMAHPNLNLRDPVMYRILHADHPRTGGKWCIYPMYDYAHGQSDWLEGITHSICTLEFEDHKPLYDWYIDQIASFGAAPPGIAYRPRQYEFARLNVTHMMMSKRKLLQLVQDKAVRGWDDPRMPTIAGIRRRGFTPESLRDFADRIGVAKRENTIEIELLEHCLREDLNKRAPRAMAVLRPLKVVIENYPQGQIEELDAVNNPEDPSAGTRKVPFGREIYIEQEDFAQVPPPKYFRLSPGKEVRLRWGYLITCTGVTKDPATGAIQELRCTYDPATRGGNAPDGRKVKATIHWVAAAQAVDAQVRLYDHLFTKDDPNDVPEGADWRSNINPKSLEVLTGCKVEPSLAAPTHANSASSRWTDGIARYQFERQGYFCVDAESTSDRLVFNRTVTLRDTWAKLAAKSD
ncbi:MAG: glutamine--tRNA ligase/YqeY domain fusion protein [Phycisphaeraceae bacterium]|nr:glutamine--tRNA ligase/YqeY domain fusion protein [Phycisphaeraceae bacterium]